MKITGIAISFLMLIFGYYITQGDWPSSIALSEEGTKLALGQFKLKFTIPGITMICCGTAIAITSMLQRRN